MKNTYIDEIYHTYIEDEFSFEEELYNHLKEVEEEE